MQFAMWFIATAIYIVFSCIRADPMGVVPERVAGLVSSPLGDMIDALSMRTVGILAAFMMLDQVLFLTRALT